MADKECICGCEMEIAAVDVGYRFLCTTCQAQDFDRERFEITSKMIGELDPIEYLSRRKRLKSEVTVTLDSNPKPDSNVTADQRTTSLTPKSPPKKESSEHWVFTDSSVMSDSSKIGLGILPENARCGKYQIRSMLGQGGMGIVYEGFDTDLDRTVALKVLNRDLCRNQRFIDRFKLEAKAAARLSHRNITHVYTIGEENGNHYFAMEFVDGQNLAEVLSDVGTLPPVKALDIIRQTAVGLRVALQSKIIHRDVKPSNLLLTNEGEVKITDFGLAKAVMGSAVELTTTGVVMGTPVYMSPEQSKGVAVDHRSDIYSLGATFYHLVVGRAPFQADSPIATILKHINEAVKFPDDCDIPTPICHVIKHMLNKDPDDRYAHYDELILDLDRLIKGDEIGISNALSEAHVVVIHYSRPSASHTNLFRVGKLSLARTNLKLGRREKAVTLLQEIASREEDATLKAEAGLILLDLFDREGDMTNARRMAEAVARCNVEGASTYAIWKLARYDDEDVLTKEKAALSHYERLLLHAHPEHRPIIDTQITRLKNRIIVSEQDLAALQVILVEG
jgi:predicted Ser/Thr protein kinase